jgi:hypothetical protein
LRNGVLGRFQVVAPVVDGRSRKSCCIFKVQNSIFVVDLGFRIYPGFIWNLYRAYLEFINDLLAPYGFYLRFYRELIDNL